MRNVSEFPDLAALTVDQSTDKLVMIHHVSKIGKSLKKSKKSEKVVALHGFSYPASFLWFKSASDLFSKENIVKFHLPSSDDFKIFESTIDFKILLPTNVDKKTTKESLSNKFRNIVLLPPFVVNTILSTSHKDAPSLAMTVSAASSNFKDQHKEHPDFEEQDHQDATNCLLGFLRAHQKYFLCPLPCGFKTDETIDFWSKNVHDRELLPKSAPSPAGSNLGSHDDTISNFASGVAHLNTILEEHLLADKSSKKNKFENLNTES